MQLYIYKGGIDRSHQSQEDETSRSRFKSRFRPAAEAERRLAGTAASSAVVIQVKVQTGGRGGATARRRGGFLGGRAPAVGVAARSRGLLIPPAGRRRQGSAALCPTHYHHHPPNRLECTAASNSISRWKCWLGQKEESCCLRHFFGTTTS